MSGKKSTVFLRSHHCWRRQGDRKAGRQAEEQQQRENWCRVGNREGRNRWRQDTVSLNVEVLEASQAETFLLGYHWSQFLSLEYSLSLCLSMHLSLLLKTLSSVGESVPSESDLVYSALRCPVLRVLSHPT